MKEIWEVNEIFGMASETVARFESEETARGWAETKYDTVYDFVPMGKSSGAFLQSVVVGDGVSDTL